MLDVFFVSVDCRIVVVVAAAVVVTVEALTIDILWLILLIIADNIAIFYI